MDDYSALLRGPAPVSYTHLKRTEVSLESLPDEPAYQESGFAAAEEKANLRALTAQLEPERCV